MKLYYSPGACSFSPHIVLLEAGLPFTLEKVDFKTKKTAAGIDFLTINSKGSVPALQLDDGRVLTEGPAVVQYLADQKPDSGLAPRAGTFERYQLMEILNFITSELHKTYGPLFNPKISADWKASVLLILDKKLGKHLHGGGRVFVYRTALVRPCRSRSDALAGVDGLSVARRATSESRTGA